MRKRCVWSAVLLGCAVFAGNLPGQAPVSGAVTGVVTVSFNTAVLQSAEAQKGMSALQAKYGPREAQLKALNDQIADIQKQLDTAGDKLSDADRAGREQAIAAKQKQLQRNADDFKSDTQSDSQDVFQQVARKMYAFLQKYAQQKGYSMVVERGSDAQPVVWYSSASLDITVDLVKAYDAQSGVAAPAPAKPAAAKPPAPAPK